MSTANVALEQYVAELEGGKSDEQVVLEADMADIVEILAIRKAWAEEPSGGEAHQFVYESEFRNLTVSLGDWVRAHDAGAGDES